MIVGVNSAAPNTTLLLAIGASADRLGGIPLPFVLPGTETAPSGACAVHNDILLTLPVATNGAGVGQVTLNVAVGPDFNGLNLFTQFFAVDSAANN